MKTSLASILSFVLFLSASNGMAREIKNSEHTLNIGRVVELVKLVNKTDIKVNVAVFDLGGSTDVSPTQELYFNLYSKGEMFSTDASFLIGSIYSFKKATRVSGGVYELEVIGVDSETSMPVDQTLVVDAQNAIVSLKNVKCEDFDCEASKNFHALIDVIKK